MKAATGRVGQEAMIAFCDQEGTADDLCGKATRPWTTSNWAAWMAWPSRDDNGVSCEPASDV